MKTEQQVTTVRGSGEFPIDMLRHDTCYPCTETDSARILEVGRRGVTVERRVSVKQPWTQARWESFGWKVMQ